MDYESVNFLPRPLRLTRQHTTMWRNNSTLSSVNPNTSTRSRIRQVGESVIERARRRQTTQRVLRATQHAMTRQAQLLRARSRTALANQRRNGGQQDANGGETKSSFYLRKPKIKMTKMEQQLQLCSVVRNGAGSVSCVSGSQAVQALATLWDVTDINNAIVTTLGQSATGQNSSKIALLSGHADVMFTNSNTSCNAHCTIYECMSRQDGSDINTSPVLLFQAGGVDAVGGAAADYLVPGTTPYSNPRFASGYKILQTTPLVVHAGATHVHRIRYEPNRVISKERVVTSDSAGPIGNVTLYTFIVFHGTPVHSAAAETTVSTGIVKLDYVFTETLKFKCMQYNYALNSIVNSLTVIADPEQFVEEPAADTANTV